MRTPALVSSSQWAWGILACTMGSLFYCYEFILRVIPGVLQAELCVALGNIPAATFGQLAAMYYFAYSPMQFPVGMLMDRFGPRRLLTFACLCCALGSFIFSYSSSLIIAGFGRFLIGFGSSFAFVGVLSLTVHWLPRRYFSLVIGLVSSLCMLGVVYGEIEVTQLVQHHGLDYVLELLIGLGVILSVLIYLIVRDGPGGYDIMQESVASFLIQVWHVLISPQVWLIGCMGACMYTSLSVFGELWGKSYLVLAYHLTRLEAAQSISMIFLGWGLGAPIAGYWSDRTGRRVPPLIMGALGSLVCISLVLYLPWFSHTALNGLLFAYGVFSGTEIIVFIMAKETTRSLVSGTVFAAVNMIVSLVGGFFQPLIGMILDVCAKGRILEGGVHVYRVHEYQRALSILPLSLLLVIGLSFLLRDARKT